jgi:FdhD protein
LKRYQQPFEPDEATRPSVMPWRIRRVTERGSEPVEAGVVIEEPLEIRIAGRPVATLMRTPGLEKELAAGFCLGEGLVAGLGDIALIRHCGRTGSDELAPEDLDELDTSRNRVDVTLMPGVERREPDSDAVPLIRSGCGRADATALAEGLVPVSSEVRLGLDVLHAVMGQIRERQTAYQAAGGIHAAAVLDVYGRLLVVAEDVGRHNAVDKATGYCLLRGVPLHDKLLVSTGRASFDMVAKGVRLGFPLLASLSSPTSAAVEMAKALNCTLMGYLRGKALNVYTHAWRIAGLD